MKINEEQKQQYQEYVKQVTPTHNLPKEVGKAFLTGGLICVLGQFLQNTGLVPITGSANGIASSAIEYKKEGQVFGIGSKIFTIAGPVILYGVFTSWILGLIYWVITL